MSRPVTLFTGQWADLPLAELAKKAAEWGFDGLELASWGDHFDVAGALADASYCREHTELLGANGLRCWAIGAHLVGQAVCDPIDARHRGILPDEVWGDGDPEGVRSRAAERLKDTARAAAQMGVTIVTGFSGSPIWHLLYSFPPNDFAELEHGYEQFAERFTPILDVFDAEGVRFALEVHPTEIAYDFVTTARRCARSTAAMLRDQLRPQPPGPPVPRPPRSSTSSPIASTTPTSRTVRAGSTVAARSSARTWTSATRTGAGSSSRPAMATSTSRACSAH